MPYVSRGPACTTLPQRPTLSRPPPTQQHYSSCLSVTRHPYLFTPKIQPLTAPHFPSTQNPLHPPATMRIERGNFPMSTEKQIAANRINAQKSTGPSTPEGRAAVRLNGVKHGLTAQTLVLKGESESDITPLLDSYEAEHEPATPTA